MKWSFGVFTSRANPWAGPRQQRLDEVNLLKQADVLSNGLVIAPNGASDLREIGELTGKSSTDLQKARILITPCDSGVLWDVAFNHGPDIRAVPVATPPFCATLDGIRVTTGRDELEQLIASEGFGSLRQLPPKGSLTAMTS